MNLYCGAGMMSLCRPNGSSHHTGSLEKKPNRLLDYKLCGQQKCMILGFVHHYNQLLMTKCQRFTERRLDHH